MSTITRRDFLKLSGLAAGVAGTSYFVPRAVAALNSLTAPASESLGIDPLMAPSDMADKVFGPGEWSKAPNFSNYRVYVKNSGHDSADLETLGQITITDPTGTESTDHNAIDGKANAFSALFVVNYDQMPPEMAAIRQQPERAGLDSQMLWARGNGDVKITYVWGDGSESIVDGHVTGERFEGTVDGKKRSMPAAFQMAYFDQTVDPTSPDALIAGKAIKAAPAAVLVQAICDPGSFMQFPTGPSSALDADGTGNRDYKDAGLLFAAD